MEVEDYESYCINEYIQCLLYQSILYLIWIAIVPKM